MVFAFTAFASLRAPNRLSCRFVAPNAAPQHKGSHPLTTSNKQNAPRRGRSVYLAEREGFEPSMGFLAPYSLSRGAPSAARPPLQKLVFNGSSNYASIRHIRRSYGARYSGHPALRPAGRRRCARRSNLLPANWSAARPPLQNSTYKICNIRPVRHRRRCERITGLLRRVKGGVQVGLACCAASRSFWIRS